MTGPLKEDVQMSSEAILNSHCERWREEERTHGKVYNLNPNVKAVNFWLKLKVMNLFYVESGTQDMLDHTTTNMQYK